MASRYVRSLFWLCTCTGLGVGLLIVTTRSEREIERLRKELPGIEKPQEVYSKNQQFLNVLQAASDHNKPLYRMSKKDIEKELKSD